MFRGHARAFLQHYLAPHPAREVRALFWSRTILNFSGSCVSIYSAIFLYKNGFSAPLVIGYYALMILVYTLGLPLAARLCRRHGYEHTMLLAGPFLILCNITMMAVPHLAWMAFVGAFFGGLYKLFYWPGYHASFATWSKNDEDGREISNINAARALMSMVGPAAGGLITYYLGFNALFIFASVVALVSFFPLLRIPAVIIQQPFPYWDAWRRLFARENRRLLVSNASFGEDIIVSAVWPVFVFINIVNVAVIGALSSLAEGVNTLILLETGRRTDEHRDQRRHLLRLGAVGTILTHFARPFLTTNVGVFAANVAHGLAGHCLIVPFTADVYEDAKRTDIMERIVFMEMALNLGRLLLATMAIAVLLIWPGAWAAVFIITGLWSTSFLLLGRK